MLSPTLKNAAIECVRQCITRIAEYSNHSVEMPSVSFNQRGKVAGSARLQTNEIRLNSVLYNDNQQEFLSQVIPHEVCHIAVFQIYGRVRPHGYEWQNLMQNVFGLKPDVRHAMDTTKVQGATYKYVCRCGPVELSIRRHNKVARKQQQYVCRKCGDVLKHSA